MNDCIGKPARLQTLQDVLAKVTKQRKQPDPCDGCGEIKGDDYTECCCADKLVYTAASAAAVRSGLDKSARREAPTRLRKTNAVMA